VPQFKISEAAALLEISDDTVRRYIDQGKLTAERKRASHAVIDGAALSEFARGHARTAADPSGVLSSARNRMVGLVTSVATDAVMAQVEIQCGPHRVVSLMSREARRAGAGTESAGRRGGQVDQRGRRDTSVGPRSSGTIYRCWRSSASGLVW
jgi:excisionase family DNA binding protein